MSLFDKDIIEELDLINLIADEVEESIHLEYKSSDALVKNDSAKKEICKDVSAFANSDGGIIIYGIAEENHKPKSFSFIDGDIFTKEQLEQIIQTGIQRKISDLKITPIRIENDIKKTIYVVKIPSSIDAPHITSKENRFFRRHNFDVLRMEEYEIRESYNRKDVTNLVIHSHLTAIKSFNKEKKAIELGLEVLIKNVGRVVENQYKFLLSINRHSELSMGLHYDLHLNYLITNRIEDVIISSTNQTPIFPDEIMNVMNITITIPESYIVEVINKVDMDFKLYYSSGDESFNVKFNELFDTERVQNFISSQKLILINA